MALFAALWLALPAFWAAAAQPQSAATQATAALQRGDFAAAEGILRAESNAHPDDAWVLSLLGCALDNEKKSAEAEPFHEKAVNLAPANVDILSNYGTHLWITGQFAKAEATFTQALAVAPTSQKILYSLAAVAANAGDYPRARDVLQDALAQQPKNVDILYRLAAVDETLKHPEQAAVLLARAERLDPKRADVEKLLAVAATELGALADAAAAWDRYLALEPGDEAARRERTYTAARMGKSDGIAELQRYVEQHPSDKTGQLELGQAERPADPKLALEHLNQALRLDPNYAAARLARGEVYFQNGDFASALPDLEKAASLDPDHAANLDRLGQTYLELDRADDAVRVLRRAADIAPADSKILLHFGRALADAGQTEESKAVLDRFRELGPEPKGGEPAGVVAYLGMTPQERRTDLRERVEKAVREHPENAEDQLEYLKLSLDSGDAARAAETANRIVALNPDARVLADAGHALLEARKFDLAQQLLRPAGTAPRAPTDLALAIFRGGGGNASAARAGLQTLDSIAADRRDTEYDFAKAEMLEALGKTSDAVTALNVAVFSAPDRPETAVRAAAFLLTKNHSVEAGTLLDAAAVANLGNREILAMEAAISESRGHTDDALKLLEELRQRSPEWPAAWAMSGIVLARHEKYEPAVRSLESAVALGAQDSAIYFYLAKAYGALNRPADAAKAKAKLPPKGDEAAYANRIFDGGLLIGPERER